MKKIIIILAVISLVSCTYLLSYAHFIKSAIVFTHNGNYMIELDGKTWVYDIGGYFLR